MTIDATDRAVLDAFDSAHTDDDGWSGWHDVIHELPRLDRDVVVDRMVTLAQRGLLLCSGHAGDERFMRNDRAYAAERSAARRGDDASLMALFDDIEWASD